MKALLSFAPLLWQFRSRMAISVLLSLVTVAAGIGLLGLSGWFLTASALAVSGAAFNLFVPSAGVRAFSFIRILARYGDKLTGHQLTLSLLAQLRQWLFAKLFPLVPFGGRLGRGDIINRLVVDVEAVDSVFLMAIGPISTAAITGIAMTGLLSWVLPGAAPVYGFAYLAAVLLAPAFVVLAARRAGAQAAEMSARLRQDVLDGIDGHRELVVFGAAGAALRQAIDTVGALGKARRTIASIGAVGSAGVQMAAAAAQFGTLVSGLDALARATIDPAVMVGVLLAVLASFEATTQLVRGATRLANGAAAAERLAEITGRAPPTPFVPRRDVNVVFYGVTFGYDPQRPILRGLDLIIEAGTCVGLTGPSGSGKSSIGWLLAGLVSPQAGTVGLPGRVAVMTQDARVFYDTVRDNLALGRADASDAEMVRMLDAVRLGPWFRALPQGLDTVLAEAGRTMSSGQARRLCLARTLLSGARVIVLDEPTDGLDAETEHDLLAELPGLLAGRTGIVITHAELPGIFVRQLRLDDGRCLELV